MESEESKLAKLRARASWKKELATKNARERMIPKWILRKQNIIKKKNEKEFLRRYCKINSLGSRSTI